MEKRIKIVNESSNGSGPNWSARIDRSISMGNGSFGIRIDLGTKSLYMHGRKAYDWEMEDYVAAMGRKPQDLHFVTINEYYGTDSNFLNLIRRNGSEKKVFIDVPKDKSISEAFEDEVNRMYNNTFLKRVLLRNKA
ncbi:MAG: hypothetical protein KGI06_04775 [Candidatus Micrarchaeota archaeon]|nr:hypothetical protein [Candidatus Micrarchaeota archaeon]